MSKQLEQPVADQRVLIIEDRPDDLQDVRESLEHIQQAAREKVGIGEIMKEEANSVASAQRLLEQARSRPYDLALLDLRLPLNDPNDGSDSLENGQDLLDFIIASQTARGVVVISSYDDYQNVKESFLGGALDFVNKPLEQESFEPAILNALSRLISQQCDRLLTQRVFELVTHSQLGLAHGFRQVFFTLLRGVAEAADGIERYARERYGLDREKDPDDPLTLLLSTHQDAIKTAREEWAGMQAELVASSSDFEVVKPGELLRNIEGVLKPALVVKKLVLAIGKDYDKSVHTFEKDVALVLREIVSGALSELSTNGKVRQMSAHFVTEATRAGVVFEDDLEPLPEKQVQAINSGQRIIPDANFGRAWGLSVAQHVAMRGGGELKLTSKRGKNIVTYYIPLAEYA